VPTDWVMVGLQTRIKEIERQIILSCRGKLDPRQGTLTSASIEPTFARFHQRRRHSAVSRGLQHTAR